MPVDPSRSCTPVGVLDDGGTALGTWPWGLASWHQQRAATATAAASSGLNACWWAALSRMLLCLALRHSVTHMNRNHRMGGQPWGHGHGGWPAGTSSAPPPPPLPPAVPGMHAGGQPCPGCSYACRSVKGLHTCRGTRSRRDSPASLAMGAGQLAPAARRHRHRCRQQWPECMLVGSPVQDAPMPGSPSQCYTHV